MSSKKKITIGIVIFIIILVILAILVYVIFNKKKETGVDAIGNIRGNIFKESAEELQNATNIIENAVEENKVATQVIQEENNETNTATDDSSAISTSNQSNSQTKTKNSDKTTTTKKSQASNTSKKEQTQTPTQTQKPSSEPTKQETAYWCIDGGTHHVAGDGANEHGYYSSWDSAYQAFEDYTKDWTSCQYKINQCACGKYYFWAIK